MLRNIQGCTVMTHENRKSFQQAEIAFAKTQTQFLARSRAVVEKDAIAEAREEKTARLRQARLARETTTRAGMSCAAPDHDRHTAEQQGAATSHGIQI